MQGMQMIFSMLFLIFTLTDKNLAENPINLSRTQKIVRPCGVHGASFFQLQEPLALGGGRASPSAKWSGGQDC